MLADLRGRRLVKAPYSALAMRLRLASVLLPAAVAIARMSNASGARMPSSPVRIRTRRLPPTLLAASSRLLLVLVQPLLERLSVQLCRERLRGLLGLALALGPLPVLVRVRIRSKAGFVAQELAQLWVLG